MGSIADYEVDEGIIRQNSTAYNINNAETPIGHRTWGQRASRRRCALADAMRGSVLRCETFVGALRFSTPAKVYYYRYEGK